MGGIARGILVARLTIYGNQAMAVSQIGVDCRPRRRGQRGVVAGGTARTALQSRGRCGRSSLSQGQHRAVWPQTGTTHSLQVGRGQPLAPHHCDDSTGIAADHPTPSLLFHENFYEHPAEELKGHCICSKERCWAAD